MKNKWIRIMLGMVLCVAAVTGCSGTKGTDSAKSAESTQEEMSAAVDTENIQKEMEESDFGEVTEIGENTLTVALGTRQESPEKMENGMTGKDGNSEGSSEEAEGTVKETANTEETGETTGAEGKGDFDGGTQKPNRGLELTLTGEEQVLTIADDTKITRQGMGGGPGGNAGGMMEKPDGEAESQMPGEDGQERPQMQDGENGEAPEMPEGGMGGGEEITLADIAVGDVISFTLDEDGNAKTIQVMSGGMEQMGQSASVDSYEAVTVDSYSDSADLSGASISTDFSDYQVEKPEEL